MKNQDANTAESVVSCFKKSKRSVRAKAGKTKEVVRRRFRATVSDALNLENRGHFGQIKSSKIGRALKKSL